MKQKNGLISNGHVTGKGPPIFFWGGIETFVLDMEYDSCQAIKTEHHWNKDGVSTDDL